MKNVTHTNANGTFNYNVPFEITCTVSGVKKTYTSVEYINGRIDKAGTLENMLKTYVSRDAKKGVVKPAEVKPEVTVAPAAEVKPEVEEKKDLFAQVRAELPAEMQADSRPIAKKDSKGMYRNSKGHIIKKTELINYQLAA